MEIMEEMEIMKIVEIMGIMEIRKKKKSCKLWRWSQFGDLKKNHVLTTVPCMYTVQCTYVQLLVKNLNFLCP